jgi:DNA adenine methylase
MGFKINRDKCRETLKLLYKKAESLEKPVSISEDIDEKLNILVSGKVGAPLRVLLSLLLAKKLNPEVNLLYPVSNVEEISGAFSGRAIDENCVQILVEQFKLPLNPTTGFLTPSFRTLSLPIPEKLGDVIGKYRQVYNAFSSIIHKVQSGELDAEEVLVALLQKLIHLKREREEKIKEKLQSASGELDLSAEDIVEIVERLLTLPRASRIPVLVVAALHITIEKCLGQKVRPLESHRAADSKTGSLGDIELVADDGSVVRVYEIKDREITETDIHNALEKIARLEQERRRKLKQYLFITTKSVDKSVLLVARNMYREIGIEMAVLDCLGFTRHFLHLFFPFRLQFISNLTKLLMEEPDSSLNHAVKEYYLTLLNVLQSG